MWQNIIVVAIFAVLYCLRDMRKPAFFPPGERIYVFAVKKANISIFQKKKSLIFEWDWKQIKLESFFVKM